MNAIYNAIQSSPDALAAAELADWSSCASALQVQSIEVRDTTPRTSNWLIIKLNGVVDQATGATEADVVLGTLQSAIVPRVRAAYDALTSIGVDLSNDQLQAMVPMLAAAAGWPAGIASKILLAGIHRVSVADQMGLGVFSSADCKSAWDTVALNQLWTTQLNDGGINVALASGDKAGLIVALKAAIAALEA